MHDFYTRIAQSFVGKPLFEGIGLPSPPRLKRSADKSLAAPQGKLLLAGANRAKVLRKLVSALAESEATLFMPHWEEPSLASQFSKHVIPTDVQVEQIRFAQTPNQRFEALVFDATGFASAGELQALYTFFHYALPHLKANGRIIILGLAERSCETVEQQLSLEATRSFVRSIAKEVGHKGTNANLIEVAHGAEKNAYPALAFLLSCKSSYVTGQSVVISNSRTNSFDWNKPLVGKTALVTGAAQGIGAETAKALARDGAVVVCLDIPANEAQLTRLASSIGGHALALDLSAPDSASTLLESITSQLGVLDIVVHNAGITRDKTLKNMPPEYWSSVLDINLEKIVEINEALLSKRVINRNGRIVGVSSISGIAGNFGQTNYACSKGGLAGYTQALTKELTTGITINAVAPGFIETRMTQKVPLLPREIGRRSNAFSQGGLPLDVAEVIAFFCHPSAQALNGNVLRVCGQSMLGK